MEGICFWRVSFLHLPLGRLTSHKSRKTILDHPTTHLNMVNADLVSWVNLRRKASFSCFHKKTSFLRPGRTPHWKLHPSLLLNSCSGNSMLWVLTDGEPAWLFGGFMPGPLFAIHLPKTWLDRYFAFNRIRGVKNTRNIQRMPKSCFVLTVIINQFLCNKKHVQLYRNAWEMAQCISELSSSLRSSFNETRRSETPDNLSVLNLKTCSSRNTFHV